MVTKKQLDVTVRDSVESLYLDRIEERLQAASYYDEKVVEKLDKEKMLNYITMLLTKGFDTFHIEYLDGDYLEYSAQYDKIMNMSEFLDEFDVDDMIKVVKDEHIETGYYDSHYILEDIAERFAVDDVFNNNFESSYSGGLTLSINGGKSIYDNIEYYSDNLTEAGDEVYDDICHINIDDYINKTFYDHDIIKPYQYSISYSEFNKMIKPCLGTIKEYLEQKIKENHENEAKLIAVFLNSTDVYVVEVLGDKIQELRAENDKIKECLKNDNC